MYGAYGGAALRVVAGAEQFVLLTDVPEGAEEGVAAGEQGAHAPAARSGEWRGVAQGMEQRRPGMVRAALAKEAVGSFVVEGE